MPDTYLPDPAEFSAFLADARAELGQVSDNMTDAAFCAVFWVLRARLTVPQAFARLPSKAAAFWHVPPDEAAGPTVGFP